jgi:hypothetical protein
MDSAALLIMWQAALFGLDSCVSFQGAREKSVSFFVLFPVKRYISA